MRLTVIGCGTVVPDPERVCSGHLLDVGSFRVLLDCGPGVVHHLARCGVEWQGITHLALTHFHNDHIGDVPMLFFALRHGMPPGRSEPIHVLGPPGTRDLFVRMASAFGEHLRDPGFPVHIQEIESTSVAALGDGVQLRTIATPHTDESLAYRIDSSFGTLGYTGDTGPSEEVARFMAGASVLVAECSLPDDAGVATHLTPTRLARMAALASPAHLVVTHVYPQLDRAALPRLLDRAGWQGRTSIAFDGMTVDLERMRA